MAGRPPRRAASYRRPLQLAGLLLLTLVALVQAVLLIRGAHDAEKSVGRSATIASGTGHPVAGGSGGGSGRRGGDGLAVADDGGIVPFVLVFESSSGSSWLLQLLSSHPAICAIGFEPIDNISMSSPSDHASRIRFLDRLWMPQTSNSEEWANWTRELQAASVFGQLPLIQRSLQRCDSRRSRAFGLKARLSRLLTDANAIQSLALLMRRRGVRVIRLFRRNRIKQALAEYNRLHAGLGQFVQSGAGTRRSSNQTDSGAVTSPTPTRSLLSAHSRRNRIKQALAEYNRLLAGLGQFVQSGAGTRRSSNGTDSNAVTSPTPTRSLLSAHSRRNRIKQESAACGLGSVCSVGCRHASL
jgi:hypothetical protein